MRRTLGALLWCAAAAAQVQVSGISVLPTGAILYATGDPAGCTIEVSDTETFQDLVAAVDDARGGRSACTGGERPSRGRSMQIVIGGPGIVTAPDGRKYSKALKPFTTYHYRIKQNGSTASSGTFTTANLPFGNLRTDPPQADPNTPGDYAYPTIDQSATNWKTTDPSTGLLYTKLTKAGDQGREVTSNVPFAGAAGGWANPQYALGDDGAAAVINGDAAATLFLLHNQTAHALGTADYADRNSLDYYQVALKGSGTAANAEDRTVQLALTADRTTPFTAWRDVTLANAEATRVAGSTTPIDLWQTPGGRALSRPDVARRSGVVNVAGTVVTYAGGQRFNLFWGSGSKITINGTEYTIASVDHDTQLTLATAAGTQNGVPYGADNFGVLIRKKTASGDTVRVQYATATYQMSTAMGWPPSGTPMCSPVVKTAGDGKEGTNCIIGHGLYFAPSDGSGLRYLGDLVADSGGGEMSEWSYYCTNFDPFDPDYVWCSCTSHANPTYRLLWRKGHYKGDHTARAGITALPFCAQNGNVQPCTEWWNLTPASSGKDLKALAKDYGGYPATYHFPEYCGISGTQKTPQNTTAMGLMCWNNQDSAAILYVLDAGNGLPVGTAGSTARVIAYTDTFSRPARRWAKSHAWWLSNNPDDNGWDVLEWHSMNLWPSAAPAQGPYTVTATSVDGVAGANLTTALSACPANTLHPGLAGQVKCTTVTVNRAPCDDDPDPTFEAAMIALNPTLHSAKCGGAGKYYLQEAAEGDYVMAQDDTSEVMEVLKISGTTWVLHRGDFYGGAKAHTVKILAMSSGMARYTDAVQGRRHAWNWQGDPYHTTAPEDTSHNLRLLNESANHYSALRNVFVTPSGCVPGDMNYTSAYGWWNMCYAARIGDITHRYTASAQDRAIALNPPVSGQPGFSIPNTVDSHPTVAPVAGSGEMFFLDGRPFDGAPTMPSQNGTLAGGQLYKFTAADFASSATTILKRKIFDTVAYAGVNPLRDVSSAATGNVIGTGPSDAYRYCYAERANECRTGSAPGDVYVNAPKVRVRGCTYEGIAASSAETRNICVFNNQPFAHRYMQHLLRQDFLGNYSRSLGSGLQLYGLFDVFMNMSATTDGKFAMFRTPFAGWVRSDAFSVEIPPIETDSVDRTEFVPVSASVPGVPGADNAVVEFGYSKFASTGADSNAAPEEFLFCTSRREKCVLAAGTSRTNPYYFAGESYSGISCGSGCEMKIPAVPGRVLYYRVLQRAGTRVISSGALKTVVVP